ncbi:MAG: hypothetical protein IKW21_00830 [Lachnospiraceae bacterium]|nr:hypothetical protein [Lachnospiraceae bacterium]
MKHPVSSERLYAIWKGMHERCENPQNHRYVDYGGRGITICEEWDYYSKFCAWAYSSGYNILLTIERKNVNGNYEPSNCCWIPLSEQANNKRNTIRPVCNGVELDIEGWEGFSSAKKRSIISKLEKGIPIKHVFYIKNNDAPRSINVRQRNTKWEYRFAAPKTLDGKRHWISKSGFDTKQAAYEAAIQRIGEIYVHQLPSTQKSVDKM